MCLYSPGNAHTERGEEPSVLAAGVALLESLLDSLLGLLALGDLGESLVGDDALEAFELEGVSGWHQVVVVDDLDEWLDLAALVLTGLAHAAGDLLWVALDTGDEGVWEGVLRGSVSCRSDRSGENYELGALVLWHDNYDLLARYSTSAGQRHQWSVFSYHICLGK